MSGWLHDLELGTDISVSGPTGETTVTEQQIRTYGSEPFPIKDRVNIICAGTGIAPMIPICRYISYGSGRREKTQIQMLYVERRPEELMCVDELISAGVELSVAFTGDLTAKSNQIIDKRIKTFYGRPDPNTLRAVFGSASDASDASDANVPVFICGSSAFNVDMKRKMNDLGYGIAYML